MNNKTLGTLALVGAPFLFLMMQVQGLNKPMADAWFTAAGGMIYISAWMCSIVALQRLEATGSSWFGKAILWISLAALTLANLSNLVLLIYPQSKPAYFYFLDMFWPLSNLIMLFVGITVVLAKRLPGWKRFVPLVVGCWSLILIVSRAIVGFTPATGLLLGLYSALAWSLLAVMVLKTKELPAASPAIDHRLRMV